MKEVLIARKKHQPEETITHLRTVEIEQAKGVSLELASKKVGVSVQTVIRWRKEHAGLDVNQLKRLKELEQENSRLKRVVADQVLDISILKEFNQGNY